MSLLTEHFDDDSDFHPLRDVAVLSMASKGEQVIAECDVT